MLISGLKGLINGVPFYFYLESPSGNDEKKSSFSFLPQDVHQPRRLLLPHNSPAPFPAFGSQFVLCASISAPPFL